MPTFTLWIFLHSWNAPVPLTRSIGFQIACQENRHRSSLQVSFAKIAHGISSLSKEDLTTGKDSFEQSIQENDVQNIKQTHNAAFVLARSHSRTNFFYRSAES